MTDAIKKFIIDRCKLSLPKTATTKSGIKYDPAQSLWKFRDQTTSIRINFELLPALSIPLIQGLKKSLIWYLANRAPGTASSVFGSFVTLARFIGEGSRAEISYILPDHILAYHKSSERAEFILANLRGFLIRWSQIGAPGLDEGVEDLLNRLTLRQSPVGEAVRTFDPTKGPLTDYEYEAVQAGLNAAYSVGKITREDLLLCYLLMALGVRPSQLALLKCCDLIAPSTNDGDFILHVPRVKQRQMSRIEFKPRRLSKQIGTPLAIHIEHVISMFSGQLADPFQAPIFPQIRKPANANAPGFAFHQTSTMLSARVTTIFAVLQIPSDRLVDSAIPLSPIRFRRTFATRAAEEGWPLLILAELMDHDDTRHVEVYAGVTTRIRANFSRRMAEDMAALASVFTGKIVHSECEARRAGHQSRIVDLRIDESGAAMGSCGSYVQCSFARPTACYGGCHDFEPWLDGPHEQALDFMLERRKQLIECTDLRIAQVNDRAILGCAQVILRCREINAKAEPR